MKRGGPGASGRGLVAELRGLVAELRGPTGMRSGWSACPKLLLGAAAVGWCQPVRL